MKFSIMQFSAVRCPLPLLGLHSVLKPKAFLLRQRASNDSYRYLHKRPVVPRFNRKWKMY